MLAALLTYACLGCLVGLLAGILGLGGGIVIVPILVYTLPLFGVAEQVQHLALGTSMASIVFTSLSSVTAHHRRGSVLWGIVAKFTPGSVLGTVLGGTVAVHMPTKFLMGVFTLFLFCVGVQMFRDAKPKASRHLPSTPALLAVGGAIGLFSSFVGISGGSQIIPFLTFCNVPLRQAIGTSAALGMPIALFGSLSYMLNGWSTPGLPPWSLGYVYLPAVAGLSAVSMCVAPWGAKLAHLLPVPRLKRLFALLLFVLAANMAWKTLS